MSNPLQSRKLWLAIASTLVLFLNKKLDWGLPEDTALTIAGIVCTYLIGQSYVDGAKKAGRPIKSHKEAHSMDKLIKFFPQLLHMLGVLATADKNRNGIIDGDETTAAIVRVLPDVQAMLPKGVTFTGRLATYDGQVEFSERMVELIEEYSK